LGDNHFQLDPAEPAHFEELLRQIPAGTPLRGAIHLWSLDAVIGDETSEEGVEQATALACASALYLAQALLKQEGAPVPLWLVTRGAQAVTERESAIPSQATVWGLGQVITLEHPELRCVRLDLDPTAGTEQNAGTLLAELSQAAATEDQLAIRQGMRRARRLVRSQKMTSGQAPLQLDQGTILITGGLAGL